MQLLVALGTLGMLGMFGMMMRISQAFPSKYLRAEDLQGREFTLHIDYVEMADMEADGDQKPVIFFRNASKALTLNKTNAATIAEHYGDETDGWAGRPIIVFPARTDYRGKNVACIRVRVPGSPPDHSQAADPPASTLPAEQPQADGQVADSEIPF